MRRFCLKLGWFICLPLITLIPFLWQYVKQDYYCDVKDYQNYSWKYNFQVLGDLSTKKLLKSTLPYNSFVLGSSRSCGLYAGYVQQKIKNSVFFHYANWNESIGGIYAKLHLLDSLGYSLDNVLIYIDTDLTFKDEGRCVNDHFLLTQQSRSEYYLSHLKNFIPPFINSERFNLLFFNEIKPESYPNWESDPVSNDVHIITDSLLKTYGNTGEGFAFTPTKSALNTNDTVMNRDSLVYLAKQISEGEYNMLLDIQHLLHKKNTRYYIVITPLHDKYKFNPKDMKIMEDLLGSGHIYDFSGVNEITRYANNYPDGYHFLPAVSKMIADSILVFPMNNDRFITSVE